MKKLVFLLSWLLSFSPAIAKEETASYIQLSSGKELRVLIAGELKTPEEMKLGRAYQFMYETKTPLGDEKALEQEARTVLAYLKDKLPADFQTLYIQCEEPYTGKMLIGKNGQDFKFTKESGQWVLKTN